MGESSRSRRRRTPPVKEIARNLQRDFQDLMRYLDTEVVPEVRTHSTGALRTAAREMTRLADYLERTQKRR